MERSFDESICSRRNRTHSNVSTQKRGNILLFFLCFVPDIWYLVLSNNISPPHRNSNTFTIGMTGLRMATVTAVHLLWFKSCFLGPVMSKNLLIIKSLTEAEICIFFCWKENTNEGSCKTVRVHYYAIYAHTVSYCLSLDSLLKRNNSAPP